MSDFIDEKKIFRKNELNQTNAEPSASINLTGITREKMRSTGVLPGRKFRPAQVLPPIKGGDKIPMPPSQPKAPCRVPKPPKSPKPSRLSRAPRFSQLSTIPTLPLIPKPPSAPKQDSKRRTSKLTTTALPPVSFYLIHFLITTL